MECTVKWIEGGMSFVAETGSGHAFVIDGAPEAGGRNLGPRPMETVLAGTGACTAFDVVLNLKRSGQDVTACKVDVKAERAETDPEVFTKIHMHFVVRGRNLKPSLVESAQNAALSFTCKISPASWAACRPRTTCRQTSRKFCAR